MELLIWYSYNHDSFKTRIGYLRYGQDIGYVNGFGEELMAIYTIPRKSTPREKLIDFLKQLTYKLEHPFYKTKKIVYIEKKPRKQWWQK